MHQTNQLKTFKRTAVATALFYFFTPFALGDTNTALDEINVQAEQSNINIKEQKVGETTKNARQLTRQQVQDSRDLVRYETGISVVETGRFGTSGYAVRGVEENRVGISIDGLRQAETLNSQGFKELFEGYGNFNNTRNSVEIETLSTATITKGADSIKSGSGALGGSVIFNTKDARDFLLDKNWYVSYKKGYNSVNSENWDSINIAARYKWFDMLLINTKRDGREHKNFYYNIYKNAEEDFNAEGETREKADPYHIDKDSTLVKLAFQPSDNHRFVFALDDSSLESQGTDLSYVLRPSQFSNQYIKGERLTHDQSKRKNLSFSYESFTQTPFWDHLKLSYSKQKITNNARTDEFCFQSKCVQVANPEGLNLVEENNTYTVVDKDNGKLSSTTKQIGYGTRVFFNNSKGTEIANSDIYKAPIDSILIDCEKLNCANKFSVFVEKDAAYTSKYVFEERPIIEKTLSNGKKYGLLERKSQNASWDSTGTFKQYEETFFLFPRSAGFSRNDYNDRDLNTNTKQINLDLDKTFSLLKTEHKINYGGAYSKIHKNMVNKDGYQGGNVQWWADNFFCNKPIEGTFPREYMPSPELYPAIPVDCTGKLRAKTGERSSYLIPVSTKEHSLYFGDNIQLGRYVNLDLNYRYDNVKHHPYYDPNTPVPKGLIAGIFVPLKGNPYGTDATCPYNSDCMNENVKQNLDIILQSKKYKHHSYSLGLNVDPTDWLRLQAKYANAFRAPTADEIYMTFKHPSFSIQPNINLEAEIAKTKELAITLYRNSSHLTLSMFQTNYRNFIDLVEAGQRQVEYGSTILYPFYKSENRDHAKVVGGEVNAHLQLEELNTKLKGFYLGYKYSWQKGKIHTADGYIPMNALQPNTSIYSLGYTSADNKYGIDIYITDVAAKKRNETYNPYWKEQAADENTLVQGQKVKDSAVAWRSPHYTVVDAILHIKPIKNLTLSAGVYNIFNTPYITWDSARSIRTRGTINKIDQNTGAGIKRFYAPGRNFKLSVELTF